MGIACIYTLFSFNHKKQGATVERVIASSTPSENRYTVLELGATSYKINNPTFYKASKDIFDPHTGFKRNEFYQKYLSSIRQVLPQFNLITYERCISSELSVQTKSKVTGESIPFNSIQSSSIVCHALLTKGSGITKILFEDTDSEKVIVNSPSIATHIELTLMLLFDPDYFQKLVLEEEPKPNPVPGCSFTSKYSCNPCLLEDSSSHVCPKNFCEKHGVSNSVSLGQYFTEY